MAYVSPNFKNKKALKDAIAAGRIVTVFQRNGDLTGTECPDNGKVTVEGPHYPEPHKWYGIVTVKDGVVIAVK